MKAKIYIFLIILVSNLGILNLSASDIVNPGFGEDWQSYSVPSTPAESSTSEIYTKWFVNDITKFANSVDLEAPGSANKVLNLYYGESEFINQQIGESLKDAPFQVWEVKIKLPADYIQSGTPNFVYLFRYGQDINAASNGSNYVNINNNRNIYCGGAVYRVDNPATMFVMGKEKWYRIRRIMDFSVPGQNVSNLYVYDENDILVAKKTAINVGNIPIVGAKDSGNGYNVLVSALKTTFRGGDAISDPVMLDDFRFYAASDASEPTPPDPEPAIAEGTFFALTWDPVYAKRGNFVKPLVLSKANLQIGAAEAAKKAKYSLTALPVGRRSILIAPWTDNLSEMIASNVENHIWWNNGATELAVLLDEFFKEYSAIGGELDYIISDFERSLSIWALNAAGGEPISVKFDSIVNDPRYQTEIRPRLEELGFVFPTDTSLNELYYVYNLGSNAPQDGTQLSHWKWNNLMEQRKDDYLNQAIFEPAKKYFPEIKYSNYNSMVKEEKYKIIDNLGTKHYLGGDKPGQAGTHSSPSLYGGLQEQLLTTQQPEDYPGEFLWTPFNSLLFNQQRYRPTVVSTEGHKVMPWVAWRGKVNQNVAFGDTDYFNENILHIGLGNPDPFLYFNNALTSTYTEKDDTIFSNLMFELDELVGFEDRKSLIDSTMDWGAKYILTGMEAGGRNVWRITPDLSVPGVTLENFLHSDKNKYIKFKIGDQIVKFPEGSYIYTPEKENSSFGYWVISPVNTKPKENIYDDDEICELEKVDKEKDHARKADWACKIYPNPANENVTISVVPKNKMNAQNGELGNIRIQILNSFNSIVLIDDEMQLGNTLTYSTTNLKEGVYIVKIFAGDKVESIKLVVRH